MIFAILEALDAVPALKIMEGVKAALSTTRTAAMIDRRRRGAQRVGRGWHNAVYCIIWSRADSFLSKVQSPPTPSATSINTTIEQAVEDAWQAPNIAPQAMIVDLVEVYFEVIYPM